MMDIAFNVNTSGRPGPNRRLSRTLPDGKPAESREKNRFAFIGLSGFAGTTTLTFAFADFLATCLRQTLRVAVVELSDRDCPSGGYDFDRMGLDKHFEGREYVSFYHLLSQGLPIRGLSNFDGGINWMLRVPGERFQAFEIVDFMRLASNAEGEIVLCDINGAFRRGMADESRGAEDIRKILDDMDRVFVVIDPLPSRMMADLGKLELLKDYESRGGDVVYVLNKWNRGVNAKEMRAFLRLRNPVEIPCIDSEIIYTAEYNCMSVYSVPGGADLLHESFKKMLFHHSLSTFL